MVDKIQVLTVDGVPYAVDAMSENVQKLVDVLNRWREEEFKWTDRLNMVKAAEESLHRQIILTINSEKEAAKANSAANDEQTEAAKESSGDEE